MSMASRFSAFDARAPDRINSSALFAPNSTGSPKVSSFFVRVPVLSEHRMSTPAISSMACKRETMAFSLERDSAPRAMVTESTAGMATGIEAITRIRMNWTSSRTGSPR